MNRLIQSIIYSGILLFFLTFIFSCSSKFEELQNDPNNPSVGTPNLLLPYLIQSTFYNGDPTEWAAAAQQLFYTERRESTQYWGWKADGFGWYGTIRQTVKLEEEADRVGAKAYIPIAQFIRQLAFYEQTRSVGDIPYSESMQADQDNFTPKYDTQKEIFIGMLSELGKINDQFNNMSGQTISGDLLYGGDLLKWQKLVNSYRLKILMDLSVKENDSDLNIKSQFKQIYSNPSQNPIFENNTDMPRFKFFDQENNRYPTFNRITTKIQQKLTSTVVDFLVESEDPRIFRMAEPAWPDDSESWTDTERTEFRNKFSSYRGLDPSIIHGEGAQQRSSNLHWRYYEDPLVEDYVKFSFSELNFILAEAILRGWIDGNAQEFFERGIIASMDFLGADNTDYLIQELSDNSTTAIEQVNMQRYISYFMNSSWEAWYNQRRTIAHLLGENRNGVPEFKAGGSHFVTEPPLRWEYPQSEIFTNETNVKEAITRQFKGENTVFGKMWMLKK